MVVDTLHPLAPWAVRISPPDPMGSETMGKRNVRAAELGDNWPLTVDEVELECLPGKRPVFHVAGQTYGMTGFAATLPNVAGLEADNPYWAENPDNPGTKKNIKPLRDVALGLCDG